MRIPRGSPVGKREKGTYFEELVRTYLRHEPIYANLCSDVWLLREVPDGLGIPLDAYNCVVNGTDAIDWVMERQAVTTDKDSGIVNDAISWATETMNNAAYPLELLLRVITVSLETNKIVNNLPKLEIE